MAGSAHHQRGASDMTITAAPATAPSQWLRVCVSTSAARERHQGGREPEPPARRGARARAPSAHSSAAAITPPEVIWFENTEASR